MSAGVSRNRRGNPRGENHIPAAGGQKRNQADGRRNRGGSPDEKCKTLAKKIKLLVDNTSVYADWLNNDSLKSQLNSDLTKLIYWEGYPPEWDEEVFNQVLAQVENYKKHED